MYYGGITRGDKDFKTVLTSIKQKSPELIFFGGIYADAGLLVKQAREIGMEAPFMKGAAVRYSASAARTSVQSMPAALSSRART